MHDTDHTRPHAFASRPLTAALALLAALSLPLAPTAHAATDPVELAGTGRASSDAPGAGVLRMGAPSALAPGSGAAASPVDALLLDTTLTLDVRGLLAELTLTQTFRNDSAAWLDGRYLFPLPADAAVRGLELRVGERVVTGEVAERDAARETFERAQAAGQIAGLVEQQRPNLFTARVASIAPGAEVRVRLDVLLPVATSDERLSLTLPTTLTPRYAHARAGESAETPPFAEGPFTRGSTASADASRGPRLSLSARIAPLADPSRVTSDTHRLDVYGEHVVLRDVPMDRDIVLAWPFADGAAPSAAAFSAEHAGERYVQLFMAPPAERTADRLPRELVIVVDTSGSMAGLSIEAAREAALAALDGLSPEDTLNLIAFDERTRALFDTPRTADAATLDRARRFLRGLRADGGTEMVPALRRALAAPFESDPDASSAALRQVVFLTDGSIAEEGRLLRLIRRELGRSRLFTVGIGSAPNAWFLDKAAEAGRGTSLAIRDLDDVRDAITALLGRLERPVLTEIAVQFPGGRGEIYPARVPDLYADSPLMLVARVDGKPREALVSGWRGDERFTRRIALPSGTADGEVDGKVDGEANEEADGSRVAPALAMRWARARVDSLLDEQRESHDAELHREAITALALDVGLITPYTSFVAVERRPRRPLGEAASPTDIANLLPDGNEMTLVEPGVSGMGVSDMVVVGMPRGAAGMDSLAWLAALFATFGVLCIAMANRLGARAQAIRADAARPIGVRSTAPCSNTARSIAPGLGTDRTLALVRRAGDVGHR